jgi:FlaA1/EpsC-like NDP-sugar epimerase
MDTLQPEPASTATVWHRIDLALARARRHRQAFSLLTDLLVVVLAWNATYLFRLGFERWISARADYDALVLLGVLGAYTTAFVLARTPQGIWRFSGFGEVRRLALACAAAGVLSALVIMGLGLVKIPRSVLALHPVFTLMGLALVRMLYRMLVEHLRERIAGGGELKRALVLGAGEAARCCWPACARRAGWCWACSTTTLPSRARALPACRCSGRWRGWPSPRCAARPRTWSSPCPRPRAPSAAARWSSPPAPACRCSPCPAPTSCAAAAPPSSACATSSPKTCWAASPCSWTSPASARCWPAAPCSSPAPAAASAASWCGRWRASGPRGWCWWSCRSSTSTPSSRSWPGLHPALVRVPLVADVKDGEAMRQLMQRWRPAVVFHAAAYKHVPLMEGDNAGAALANNVLGTWQAARAAAAAGVERFVLVSTDKAVNPTNVMGATKRAAERVVGALAAAEPGTRFVAVRFGNVLGSSGSVIPRFKEQIARGGPVTVTHPDIIRYFMTIPEAARLVLQAAAVGASGQVMVLDMGEPVKIVDLARDLIRLAGHTPEEIAIEFTGLRPGEKLYEELLADDDASLPTPVPRLRVARMAGAATAEELQRWIAEAEAARGDERAARALLVRWVPEYRPAAAVQPVAEPVLATPRATSQSQSSPAAASGDSAAASMRSSGASGAS